MPLLDDILSKTGGEVQPDPRLRDWAERIRRTNDKPGLEIHKPAAAFGAGQPEMVLHFTAQGVTPPQETLAWDDELNAGLIQLGVRATDAENEAERFALGLRAALRRAEREFGGGYFNAVLYELVTESDLTRYPAIADIIKYAYALGPPRDSRAYDACRDMIAAGIAGRKKELDSPLGYPPDEARSILTHALALYLDERFSVSSRRRLGLL